MDAAAGMMLMGWDGNGGGLRSCSRRMACCRRSLARSLGRSLAQLLAASIVPAPIPGCNAISGE